VETNILQRIKRWKVNWIGHILHRNCLLKHVTEGKLEETIEGAGTSGKGRKQLLDDFKETKGYWKLKQETLYITVWRIGCGRGRGPFAR
jgi:hypothetical protein